MGLDPFWPEFTHITGSINVIFGLFLSSMENIVYLEYNKSLDLGLYPDSHVESRCIDFSLIGLLWLS